MLAMSKYKCNTSFQYKSNIIGPSSNIYILEPFQMKALSMIMDAPWYVPNTVI
jgi:hypothetical protein